MTQKVCLITGVGPGTGAALVRKFAEDYQVAMLARSEDRLAALSEEIPNAHAFPCDVADTAALQSTIAKVQQDLGDPAVVVHNAAWARRWRETLGRKACTCRSSPSMR